MSIRTILLSIPLLSNLTACTITPPAGELIEGHLRPCPNRPNCVTSDNGASRQVAPISFHSSPEEAWQQMQMTIQELGGVVSKRRPMYLLATFTSTLFHFVDDVELRMDAQEKQIHIRSGARVGYSDFGVNRKRVEKIRKLFPQEPKQDT